MADFEQDMTEDIEAWLAEIEREEAATQAASSQQQPPTEQSKELKHEEHNTSYTIANCLLNTLSSIYSTTNACSFPAARSSSLTS